MKHHRLFVAIAALAVTGAASSADALQPRRKLPTPPVPSRTPPIPPVPGKSLPVAGRVVRVFPAEGVETVVLRAEDAERAEVKTSPGTRVVAVSGIPEGGTFGYHPPDPNWRETPASKWGLDFKAKGFGPTLVISTEKEISYIHHHYHFSGLTISVPPNVEVVKEGRKLTGEGAADLSAPIER